MCVCFVDSFLAPYGAPRWFHAWHLKFNLFILSDAMSGIVFCRLDWRQNKLAIFSFTITRLALTIFCSILSFKICLVWVISVLWPIFCNKINFFLQYFVNFFIQFFIYCSSYCTLMRSLDLARNIGNESSLK